MKFSSQIVSRTLLILILTSFSCQKAQLLGEYYLGNLKYENPYQGNETLVFQTSNNYSLTFSCQGRYSITNETKPGINSNDYYLWEADYTNFTELNGDYDFSIDMRIMRESAGMGVRMDDYITDTDTLIYIRAAAHFSLPLDNGNLHEGQVFYDSLDILGTTYYDVFGDSVKQFRIIRNTPIPIDTNQVMLTKLFYNTSHGILKLNFTDGSWWSLIEIH